MERLTTSNYELYPCLDCNKQDECYEKGWCIHLIRAILRLANYEKLEDQGRLIKLPCKPGDTLYTNMRVQGWYMRSAKAPYKVTVAFVGINGKDNFFNVVYENQNMWQFKFSDIGKNIFLSYQEALEAKERMNHEK